MGLDGRTITGAMEVVNHAQIGTAWSCHMSMGEQFYAPVGTPRLHRCRGMAIFRSNLGVSDELAPDPETVFAGTIEAYEGWGCW